MTAYLEVDREAGAPALRRRRCESGRPAEAEHAALLEIEEALEAAALSRLKGKRGGAAKTTLESTGVRP